MIENDLMLDERICTCSRGRIYQCVPSDYEQRMMLYSDEAWHNITMKNRARNLIEFMFNLTHENTIIITNMEYYEVVIYCLDCQQSQLISHDYTDPMAILERMMKL